MNSKTQKLEIADFEIGQIKAMYAGQAFAFVATSLGLGIAIKGQAGYTPIPLDWFRCDSITRSQDYADQLNEYALNISRREAIEITCSSMFPKVYEARS